MTSLLESQQLVIQTATAAICRFCGTGLRRTFIDLGMSPLCESYPSAEDLNHGEVYYPLHVYVCEECFLVQLEEYEKPEKIFTDYAYFSSFSDSWLKHADDYCGKMTASLGLNRESHVIEVASNDGYLLQYFVNRNIPVLGIEPAANVAKVAVERGVPTLVKFFGSSLAKTQPGGFPVRVRCSITVRETLLQLPEIIDRVIVVTFQQVHVSRRKQRLFEPWTRRAELAQLVHGFED